jgi:hypothetical protein
MRVESRHISIGLGSTPVLCLFVQLKPSCRRNRTRQDWGNDGRESTVLAGSFDFVAGLIYLQKIHQVHSKTSGVWDFIAQAEPLFMSALLPLAQLSSALIEEQFCDYFMKLVQFLSCKSSGDWAFRPHSCA